MASHNSRATLAVGGLVLVAVGVGAVAFGARGASRGTDPVSLSGPSSSLPSPSGGAAAPLTKASGSPSPTARASVSAPARGSAGPTGNPYTANAVPDDPTADPGPDPIFARDQDLRRTGTYTYRVSQPGDQVLAAGTSAFPYDVTTRSLKTQLAARKAKLATATGIALYLTGGTTLGDADLSALQTAGRDLALPNLSRLYVYNLRTIQGGKQCTPDSGLACAGQTARGGLFPYLWFNGWWDTWVRHLILDDLTAVPDGAFSNHNFADVSLRSARSVGVMGFGHAPHAKLSVLYLPSVRTIAHDAFRRNQGLTKVVLPRATTIDDYGFDDATSLRYFNAPQLTSLGRNGLNDSGALVSVNFPKLRYLGINSINGLLTGLRLPALTTVDKSAISHFGNLRWVYTPRLESLRDDAVTDNPRLLSVYLPKVTQLNARALRGNAALRRIILGDRPPQQKADVFTGSDRATIYHTGSPRDWTGFVPAGNASLPVQAWPLVGLSVAAG
jgi:hypothetical protein